MDVAYAEGGRFTAGGTGISSGLEEEEKGDYNHVRNGVSTGSVGLEADVGGRADDMNGYGFDAPWRGVISFANWKRGGRDGSRCRWWLSDGDPSSHEGQRLAHGTNCVFRHARADESSTGRYFATAVLFGKEEDGIDGILSIEIGIDVVGMAEGGPD